MKEFQPADIRNFAVVGHASAGKTLLTEAMLACAGVINRMGSIAAGTTVSDYHESEKKRQISVSASLLKDEVASLDITEIGQSLPNHAVVFARRDRAERGRYEHANPRHLWL